MDTDADDSSGQPLSLRSQRVTVHAAGWCCGVGLPDTQHFEVGLIHASSPYNSREPSSLLQSNNVFSEEQQSTAGLKQIADPAHFPDYGRSNSSSRPSDTAELPFDYILDQLTEHDPSVTDYVLETLARCFQCGATINEKTLVVLG